MADGQRRPVSDIERFLMEVERLRKKSASAKVDDGDAVDDVEVVRPAPRLAPPPPAPPPPRPVAKPRSARRIEADPVMDAIPVRVSPAPSEFATPSAGGSLSASGLQRKMTRGGQLVSPLILQVVSMLGNREQTRAAFLLGEILSPPMSRRRR